MGEAIVAYVIIVVAVGLVANEFRKRREEDDEQRRHQRLMREISHYEEGDDQWS